MLLFAPSRAIYGREGSPLDRTQARAAAVQLLYEWAMGGGDGGEDTTLGLLELDASDKNYAYALSLAAGVKENVSALDEAIAARLRPGWRMDRLSRVDLSILRLAVYELTIEKLPAGVVINEAIELSRTFSTEEIGSFINGVLGAIARAGASGAE